MQQLATTLFDCRHLNKECPYIENSDNRQFDEKIPRIAIIGIGNPLREDDRISLDIVYAFAEAFTAIASLNASSTIPNTNSINHDASVPHEKPSCIGLNNSTKKQICFINLEDHFHLLDSIIRNHDNSIIVDSLEVYGRESFAEKKQKKEEKEEEEKEKEEKEKEKEEIEEIEEIEEVLILEILTTEKSSSSIPIESAKNDSYSEISDKIIPEKEVIENKIEQTGLESIAAINNCESKESRPDIPKKTVFIDSTSKQRSGICNIKNLPTSYQLKKSSHSLSWIDYLRTITAPRLEKELKKAISKSEKNQNQQNECFPHVLLFGITNLEQKTCQKSDKKTYSRNNQSTISHSHDVYKFRVERLAKKLAGFVESIEEAQFRVIEL